MLPSSEASKPRTELIGFHIPFTPNIPTRNPLLQLAPILLPKHLIQLRLDLQRDELGIEPAQRQIAGKEVQVLDAAPAPDAIDLALVICAFRLSFLEKEGEGGTHRGPRRACTGPRSWSRASCGSLLARRRTLFVRASVLRGARDGRTNRWRGRRRRLPSSCRL